MTTDCPTCGVTFEVCKDRKRFCSMDCRRGAAQTERLCDGCGSTFKTFRSDPQRFCNIECYAAHRPSQVVEWTERPCGACGATMRVSASNGQKSKQQYCSRKCLGVANGRRKAAQPKPRIEKPCKMCGKIMLVIPSLAERKTACSRQCNGLWLAQKSPPRASQIGDAAIIHWVEHGRFGRDLDWKPEFRISRWTVDLAFPEIALVIELDGVYWHSRPGVREKDARKDADLAKRGWRVHHIPIEGGDTPAWLAQCIDVAVARVANAPELSYITGQVLEAS